MLDKKRIIVYTYEGMKVFKELDHRKLRRADPEFWKTQPCVRCGGNFVIHFNPSELDTFEKIDSIPNLKLDDIREQVSKEFYADPSIDVAERFFELCKPEIKKLPKNEKAKVEPPQETVIFDDPEETSASILNSKRVTKNLINKRLAEETPLTNAEIKKVLKFLTSKIK